MKTQVLLLSSLVLALAGCGGGGGGAAEPTEPPDLSLQDVQGFWSGNLAGSSLQGASSTNAVVLPDGDAWFMLSTNGTPTGMVKATLAVSGPDYSGSGRVYDLATGAAPQITLAGTAEPATGLDSSFQVSGTSGTTTASLTYNDAYEQAITTADVAGAWQFTASGGAMRVDWTVQSNGALTGSSSTGCTWAGSFTTRAGGTAVLDYTATETCASVATVYSGITVLNADKDRGTVFVTTAGDAQGFVLSMDKDGS